MVEDNPNIDEFDFSNGVTLETNRQMKKEQDFLLNLFKNTKFYYFVNNNVQNLNKDIDFLKTKAKIFLNENEDL